MKSARIPTIRSRLALLVIACVVPASLMVLVLIWHDYQTDRARAVRDSIATARALTLALDRELVGVQSSLFALATSTHLFANDLRVFYGQAKEALPNLIANNIVLIDTNGQQQVNTLRPFGEVLPSEGSSQLRRIFETGRPVITDLFPGPVIGRPLLAIGVPVRRGNTVMYSLAAGILPERLSIILTQQRLPPTWIATIFDSKGTVVSRTHEINRFLGKKGSAALVKRMGEAAEDSFEGTTLEGIPVLSVFSRSDVSNWTVAIGMPLRDLTGELWRSLWWLVLGLALLLVCTLILAWSIGGQIAQSIRGLSGPALALGFGETVTVPPLHLREADEVGQALVKASEMLQEAQHRGHHDALTGLANRALFDEIVGHQLAICGRIKVPLAVLYVDLDGFKAVNDTHGHATGDELLRAVAVRLKNGIRSSDFVARLGGDEFAIVLVNTSIDAAAIVVGKLADSLSMPYPIGQLTIEISASIGVSGYPGSGTTSEALLHSADEAMYAAKAGRKQMRQTVPHEVA
ncbi:MAG TPA: sensor domain-containing diguanylate cyclase [Burkholderiales bacterium]|nr:sensor domain-containing diguanylate cyclase [Burkholderiales bacterium]